MANANRQLKEEKVAEIKEKMGKTQAIVVVKYQGLTVEEDTELRKSLREAGVEYRVYKNSLVKRALNELGYEGMAQYFEGPMAVAMGYNDPTAPARIINDFAKDHKALELISGYVQGEVFDVNKIKELASVPSKEVLIAKLLGSFKAPLSKFTYLLSAIKDKKDSEEQA